MKKNLRILLACIALVLVAGCAPIAMDGGIVGTGNRPDCEAKTRKDGTQAPVPEECKRPGAMAR